jgi:hypothetical protein
MATLDSTNHTIELVNAGADAMSNMYEIYITTPGGAAQTPLRLRTKSFSPTVLNQGTYEVKYKTATLNRPSTSIEGERTFDIGFRLDSNYAVYKGLRDWQYTLFNPNTGYTATQLNIASLGTIEVWTLKNDIYSAEQATGITKQMTGASVAYWKYHDVWIQKMTEPEFNTDSSDPQEITATFYFSYVENPKDNGSLG